jgi:hypothetical protein
LKHFHRYLLLLLVAACHSDEFTPPGTGLDYFPLETGLYQIYKVDETIYSEVTGTKTESYQIKVEVTDSFPNAEGNYTYVLSRTKRFDDNSPWVDLDTWSARIDGHQVIVNEGNVPIVKFIVPARKGNVWDGNKFNNLDEDEFEVITVDQAFQAGGISFDKTLKVLQENNDDIIVSQDIREEVYARGAGLVLKSTKQVSFCTDDDCRGQQKIKSGRVFKQEIIDYGKL